MTLEEGKTFFSGAFASNESGIRIALSVEVSFWAVIVVTIVLAIDHKLDLARSQRRLRNSLLSE